MNKIFHVEVKFVELKKNNIGKLIETNKYSTVQCMFTTKHKSKKDAMVSDDLIYNVIWFMPKFKIGNMSKTEIVSV